MQGESGGKLGMPKATDKAKKLRLPALQKHDNELLNMLWDQQQTLKPQRRVRGRTQTVHLTCRYLFMWCYAAFLRQSPGSAWNNTIQRSIDPKRIGGYKSCCNHNIVCICDALTCTGPDSDPLRDGFQATSLDQDEVERILDACIKHSDHWSGFKVAGSGCCLALQWALEALHCCTTHVFSKLAIKTDVCSWAMCYIC